MGIASSQYPEGLSERAIFCSRTLNLRAIQALGYDMGGHSLHAAAYLSRNLCPVHFSAQIMGNFSSLQYFDTVFWVADYTVRPSSWVLRVS